MPPRNLIRAFAALWITTGLTLLVGSLGTARWAFTSLDGPHLHIGLLASVESIAAALFLVPRSTRFAGVGLLVILLLAFALHALGHQWRGDLLIFASVVGFVAVHGPLTSAQWQFACGRATHDSRRST